MDAWDFVRCFGILMDNATEAAAETERPWVEILLLQQKNSLALRVSHPYLHLASPTKIWDEGFSTKGTGRGWPAIGVFWRTTPTPLPPPAGETVSLCRNRP